MIPPQKKANRASDQDFLCSARLKSIQQRGYDDPGRQLAAPLSTPSANLPPAAPFITAERGEDPPRGSPALRLSIKMNAGGLRSISRAPGSA